MKIHVPQTMLIPRGNDFNDDLVGYGARSVRRHLGSPYSR